MAFSSEIEKLERRWQENPLGLTFASLAEAYRKAGETGRALELIEQGLNQHPNYVPAHIVRGRCHLDAQSDSDAELAFLRVTELDPENVIALTSLAELSERAGRIPEAVHRLEMLLDVDRNNEGARGQLDRVKELLATAVQASAPVEVAPEPPKAAAPPVPTAVVAVPEPEAAPAIPPAPEPVSEPVSEPVGKFDESSLSDLELEASTQLTSVPSDDYQIPNDAETLVSSDERISDIVLGTEPPEDFPIHAGAYGDNSEPVLGHPAEAGLDSVDVLLGDDYASLMSYRDPSDLPEVEPPALEETVFGQVSLMAEVPAQPLDTSPVSSAAVPESQHFLPPPPVASVEAPPVMETVPAPDTDIAAESPPASQWAEPEHAEPEQVEPEQVEAAGSPEQAQAPEYATEPSFPESEHWPEQEPEAVAEASPELAMPAPEPYAMAAEPAGMVDDYVPLGDLGAPSRFEPAAPQPEEQESAAAAEPELVVTETMAEIFLRQGHRELALAVYVQLAQREPGNQRIAAALAQLTPEVPAPSQPTSEPAASFAASDTGGRSVGQLFGPLLAAARPSVAATIHPPAFEQPKRGAGEPTRPAQETLNLSSVFGEESSSSQMSGSASDSNPGEPSFDEFFAPATGPAADLELPRTPESDSDGMPAQVPEDLEQFNAWLRGLKR